VNDDRDASFRANTRRAIAAFEAVGFCAQTRSWQASPLPARTNPGRDLERLAGMLCGIRHLTDQFSGLRFHDVLRTANELYDWGRSIRPAAATEPTAASHAIDVYERSLRAATRRRGRAYWPPDTLADLNSYTASRLTAGLITSLRHYADQQGVGFSAALADGLRAYARQRLSAEGPFETGLGPAQPRATTLSPAPFPPWEPVATNQGVVTSFGDAEWLLIRTTARIRDFEHRGFGTADHRDLDDRRALADALAGACGRPAGEILGQLAPQIAARVTEIERGPAAAAELGREHGRTGIQPYCDLSIDGDATALLNAFGETEWMTSANHPYRLPLVVSYADAYKQASRHGLSGAESPARSAARDLPRQHLPSPRAGASGPRTRPASHRRGSALALSTAHGGARDDHNQRKGNTPQGETR
jgi:hypothetical protein